MMQLTWTMHGSVTCTKQGQEIKFPLTCSEAMPAMGTRADGQNAEIADPMPFEAHWLTALIRAS